MARGHFALAALALLLAGCTGGGSTVSNTPDHFAFSTGGAQTATESFDWQNGGTQARITFNGGGAGSVSITIHDSAGRQVYSKTYSGAGGTTDSGMSSTGTPGSWRVLLDYNVSGGFQLNVDRA